MAKRVINIGVEDPEAGFNRFIRSWKDAEAGEAQELGTYLDFEDLGALLSVITPKRLNLLQVLRQEGPMTIRALARTLSRDYKNVHHDVHILATHELINHCEDGSWQAPWDTINAKLQLAA